MSEVATWALHFGNEQRRVVVAGHSHVICILQALGEAPRADVTVAYTRDLHDGPPLDDAYWEFVHSATSTQLIAVMWNGNQHHASFLIQPDPPIRIWDEAAGAEVGTGLLVPQAMLHALWEPSFTQLRMALELLAPDRRVVVLGTPPPKRGSVAQANLEQEVWFSQVASERGLRIADLVLTDDRVLLAMWSMLQERLCELAQEHGVPFIPCPPEVRDEDGFLLPDYSAHDVTHANAAYGHLICDLLEAMATQ